MRRLLVLFSILLFSGICYATPADLMYSGNVPVQAPAWNGSKTVALTVYSTTTDLSGDLFYTILTSTDCYLRLMPLSTSTKASYIAEKVLKDSWTTPSVVNKYTPFANLSGCTGYIKRH